MPVHRASGVVICPDNPNTPNNLNTGNTAADTSNWSTGRVANLKTGVYWQYLQNPDVFMCPVDAAANVGEPTVGINRMTINYPVMS